MMVEGKGAVAPAPIPYLLHLGELRAIFQGTMPLNRYGGRGDAWGKGLRAALIIPQIGELSPDRRAIFVGKVGEYGVSCLCARHVGVAPPVDFKYRRGGDGGNDLALFGLRMQVKTRQSDKYPNLIKRVAGVALGGDCHVFCKWINDSYVYVLGWQWNRPLLAYPLVPARHVAGDWTNIEVPDADLLPMARLWAELMSRKEKCA